MNHSARRVLSGFGVAAMAAVLAVPVAAQDASPAASGATGSYRIGVSNPGSVGNGWREEMLCSAQAQGVASGLVSEVKIINRDTDPAGQLERAEQVGRSHAKGEDPLLNQKEKMPGR